MTNRWISIATFVSALCVVGNAHGFYVEVRGTDTAVPVRYDTAAPVEFRAGAAGMPGGDGSEFAAIERSFAAWSAVECADIAFERGPDVDDPSPQHWVSDGDAHYVLVYWPELTDGIFTDSRENMVGYFYFAQDGTGTLIGATVLLNPRYQWSTAEGGEEGKLDVQSVVTALVGRSLGITSNTEGNATYGVYRANDISKRILGDDDIAALNYLYGDAGACTIIEPEALCASDDDTCPPAPVINPSDPGTDPSPTDPGDDPAEPLTPPPPTADAGITPPPSGPGIDPGEDPATGAASGSGGCQIAWTDGVSRKAQFLLLLVLIAVRFLTRRRTLA